MPMSNYSNGFAEGVSIRGIPLSMVNPGRTFFVNNSGVPGVGASGGAAGNTGSYQKPYDTIATVLASAGCVASRGDLIVLMPGHVETVTAAAGLAMSKAGVTILSLGQGSLRGTINFTTATTATMVVSAANCTFVNVLFTGGIDALAGPLVVQAADCSFINCEYRDVTGEATRTMVANASATRLYLDGWTHRGATSAGAVNAIQLTGGSNFVMKNFWIDGTFSGAALEIVTTAHSDLDVTNGFVRSRGSSDVCFKDTITGSTGTFGPNLRLSLAANTANITEAVTGATFRVIDDVYVVNLNNEKAMLINWTASTDA